MVSRGLTAAINVNYHRLLSNLSNLPFKGTNIMGIALATAAIFAMTAFGCRQVVGTVAILEVGKVLMKLKPTAPINEKG
jgi:hypothetical protein